MLYNYLKITLRQFWRNKTFTTINIFGLAIGITACLLIMQYIKHEQSYDQFHEKGNRIHRVAMFISEQDEPEQSFAFTYPAVAPNLKKDFPEIEEAIRMRTYGFMTKRKDQIHSEDVAFVDAPFLSMFSFPLIKGDPATALSTNNSVVISETIAQKYFGQEDPMGKSIAIDAQGEWLAFEVSGVLKDVPENSHMDFDFLYPYSFYSNFVRQNGGDAENNWGWSDFYTYLLLKPGIDPDKLQAKLPAFAQQYMGDNFDQYGYLVTFSLQAFNFVFQ